ncbi:MAG TPA: TusE/DsrC/DsvC family sulfur relay protein [Anaerolineaceae bacterium]|jgi:tRNA 2-thiouridine synthesizing protein E|nr:TusE/DsrC/DsvC family sulfur relay protein [Anaerolineaceae bacterium]
MSDILSTVAFDADGFMVDANAWTPEIGAAIAAREGITLTERHMVVINYARSTWKATGDAPTLRNITKNTDVNTKELYELFPGGPGKLAAKVAGLKKPTGCI